LQGAEPVARKQFFFEKKNQKTFTQGIGRFGRRTPIDKSFLFLFFKKEILPLFVGASVFVRVGMTFAEISRVLKARGYFMGATSFLEPYHAQSTYSYTPYGFRLICERHGLKLLECARPWMA
jgi:hypothetical protein